MSVPERSNHSSGEEGEVDESTVGSAPTPVAAESKTAEQLTAAKRRRSQDLMSDVSSLEEFESGPEEGEVESEKADSPTPPPQPAVPAAPSGTLFCIHKNRFDVSSAQMLASWSEFSLTNPLQGNYFDLLAFVITLYTSYILWE